mmetsp:Transcript_31314/g.74229  ORF Transcript_31314/g.74229 Transcript_31314/m.74229 type:complete len:288 (-) Transcript_31314:150-1013(-)
MQLYCRRYFRKPSWLWTAFAAAPALIRASVAFIPPPLGKDALAFNISPRRLTTVSSRAARSSRTWLFIRRVRSASSAAYLSSFACSTRCLASMREVRSSASIRSRASRRHAARSCTSSSSSSASSSSATAPAPCRVTTAALPRRFATGAGGFTPPRSAKLGSPSCGVRPWVTRLMAWAEGLLAGRAAPAIQCCLHPSSGSNSTNSSPRETMRVLYMCPRTSLKTFFESPTAACTSLGSDLSPTGRMPRPFFSAASTFATPSVILALGPGGRSETSTLPSVRRLVTHP